MELLLVNKDICESRLYRTTAQMSNLNGRDVADLAYLNTVALYLMLQDDVQHSYASEYSYQTAKYGDYNTFRTNATDLYVLGYILKNPTNDYVRLDDHSESVNFLKSLKFDSNKHLKFMRTMSSSADKTNEAVGFFFRLESQLKISNDKYKQYRRFVTNWGNLKYSSRQLVVSKIVQDMRKLSHGGELMMPLTSMLKYKSYSAEPEYKTPRTSFAKKAAGAAIGAVAGRYIGGKLATTDKEKAKNIGTGIGAIAGYWAAGRSKKQV